ncbi:MAG: 3-hydroxybutyryl-CoA dehydrogenase [Alphaproteobacteria bacterium]|nr:3-hydroxybutyryl-CoA dehydrogenase [Alphaproteobacteria bacterium]
MSNMKISKVGVIGAGQMGCGIAQVCAAAGYKVAIYDAAPDRTKAGIAGIDASLARRVKSSKLTEEARAATLSHITAASDFAQFSDCDLVIESATENEGVKRQIFEAVTPHLKSECIIGSNTSSISITRLAATTGRPERFMGIHFMNPVPVMELVELIRGIATDETVFKTIQAFALTLGKTIAISEDYPAFIVNRILLPMINEAIYTLYEGVGSVTAIDTAMKLGAHHPMGPLELADFIGLDTCLSVMQVLHDGLADSKYRPCPLLVKYVEAGWLGRKVKRGFYDYRGETPVPTR